MKALRSELVLEDFSIIDTECHFIPFEEMGANFNEVQESYPIDIDFDVKENDAKDSIVIFAEVVINGDKKPGYHIFASGCALFSFDRSKKINHEKRIAFIQSAVSICITNLRSFVANLTAYYPMGRFNFAAIDAIDLWNQKVEMNQTKALETEHADKPTGDKARKAKK